MRHWLWILILFLFLILFAFLFPLMVSTGIGKKVVTGIVESKTGAQIEIGSLHLSWFGPQRFEKVHFKKADGGIDGSWALLTAEVPLWHLSKLQGEFSLSKGAFSLYSDRFGEVEIEEVEASVRGHSFVATGQTRQKNSSGFFTIDGTMEDPRNFSLNGTLKSIPSLLLDRLLQANGKLALAVGAFFDAKGKLRSQSGSGVADIAFSSPNSQTEIHAHFNPSTFQLTQPLTLLLKVTPEFSSSLLREINPLFLSGLSGKNPILLKIEPEGFSCPYHPFVLKKLSIDRALLDLGKVQIQNGPTLQSMLSLLTSRLQNLREMAAWVTPVEITVKKGIVKTGRLDLLLADSIHLCTWGEIDLNNDRIDMFLGLPADTLSRSFGLKGLPSNYVLKVPLRGSTRSPELETKGAAAQIAAMLGAQNIPKTKGVLGGLFGVVIDKLKNEGDVPPAKRPFPWER